MGFRLLLLLLLPCPLVGAEGQLGGCVGEIVLEGLTRSQYEAMVPAFIYRLPEITFENGPALEKVFNETAATLAGEPLLQILRFLRFAGEDPAQTGRRVRKKLYPKEETPFFYFDVLEQVQCIFQVIDAYEDLHPAEGLLEKTMLPLLKGLRRGDEWGSGNIRIITSALMLNLGRPDRVTMQARFRDAIASGPSSRALTEPHIAHLLSLSKERSGE